MVEIKLIGRIPSKKNSKIMSCMGKGKPRLFPSKNYTAWHKDAVSQIKEQNIKIFDNINLCVNINLFSPDRRKYDLTNKAESIMDLLVDCGIIIDDNYEVITDVHLKYCGVEKGGLAIVTIQEKDEQK